MTEAGKKTPENENGKGYTRKQFFKGSGAAILVGGATVGALGTVLSCQKAPEAPVVPAAPAAFTDVGGQSALQKLAATIPASQGYLVHDSKKCAGCLSCMAACSMVHEKSASLSLSRIQITQDALAPFPFDLDQFECRQCTSPLCVQNCPVGACYVDATNGNVRVIDQTKCIGCQMCIKSCPHPPHRTIWNAEINKSSKCDLCANSPYLGEKGGPGGTQACVAVCPLGALAVVSEIPDQTDENSYDVNLRVAPATTPAATPAPVTTAILSDWMFG